MQRVMQNNAAVFRTGETLQEGVKLIDQVYDMFKEVKTVDRSLVWFVLLHRRSSVALVKLT